MKTIDTNGGLVYQTPKTQKEANVLYQKLEGFMCDEVIFRDGEATYEEARDEFNFYLQVAQKIVEESGFLPTIDSDVFFFGIPEPMPKKPWPYITLK